MRRRTFIAGLLVATAAARAHAQQPAKLPTIGFLGTTTPSAWSNYVPAFVQRLSELGWVEGRTVAIEYRWAEGRNDRFGEIAAEFARLKVDVIVTSGGAGVAAKQATSTIPIVLALANDPVGSGLAASLARPGGNVTMSTRFCAAPSREIFPLNSQPSLNSLSASKRQRRSASRCRRLCSLSPTR